MDNKTIAKQTVKLIDIIPGSKTKKGKYVFVNPCPICNHNDHFIIVPSTNSYSSHNSCCKGGSIIDWFMETQGMKLNESIKYCIELAGLEDKKISNSQLRELQLKNKAIENNKHIETSIIERCYHKLTTVERALREIENKDCFLNWVLSFIESYTLRFVRAKLHDELYKLCLNFKSELHYSYTEFIRYEQDLIEVARSSPKYIG